MHDGAALASFRRIAPLLRLARLHFRATPGYEGAAILTGLQVGKPFGLSGRRSFLPTCLPYIGRTRVPFRCPS